MNQHTDKNAVRIALLVLLLFGFAAIGATLYFAYLMQQFEDQIAIMIGSVIVWRLFEIVVGFVLKAESDKAKNGK